MSNLYWESDYGLIYCGDCVEVMKQFPDDCIDLTVTSPPYDKIRKYKGFAWSFEATAQELFRITKKGGVVVWVVGDSTINGSETGTSFRQALYFKDVGFNLHDTMIYAKENPIPLTHNRYEQQFEYMFVISKGKPNTFNPIRQQTKNYGRPVSRKRDARLYDGDSIRFRDETTIIQQDHIAYNIWFYPIGKSYGDANKHPAIFPEQLAHDCIVSWSNRGDVVLDPFLGSGTTAKMAMLAERQLIGIEISEDYCELAKNRIEKYLPTQDASTPSKSHHGEILPIK